MAHITRYKQKLIERQNEAEYIGILLAAGRCCECLMYEATEGRRCFECYAKSCAKRRAFKLYVFNQYGGSICACCGETNIAFLTIDHIAGGGSKHRKEENITAGSAFYGWLKKNNFPKGYQVLCMNCNMARVYTGGVCPHKITEDKISPYQGVWVKKNEKLVYIPVPEEIPLDSHV